MASRSRKRLIDNDFRSSLEKRAKKQHLNETRQNISLRDVPMKERRKEAQKPLFLTRYE